MPPTMRAAVLTGKRQIAVEEVPLPDPPPGWVRMRVEACGICGSDLRYFHGENPWSLHTLGYNKPLPPRMVLGHELAGVIDAVGSGVDDSRIGERVVAVCFEVCGRCDACRRGKPQLCPNTMHLGHGAGFEEWALNPGGYAEYCLVWAHRAVKLPKTLGFDEAVFLDGLAVAVHATKRAPAKAGETTLVLGAGPIGLLCAQVASARDGAQVICSELESGARGHAERLVAGTAVDPRTRDVAEAALAATDGYGVQAVIDTTGNLAAQQDGIRCLAPGGTMAFLAGPAPGLELGMEELCGERSYTSSANFDPPELDEALGLLADERIRLEGLITHRYPLSQVGEALDTMERKAETGAYKIVIQPQA